jgi:hypothetical protein
MKRLLADRRGIVAFEVPTIMVLLVLGFIIPLADFSVFGYTYISAFQAMRDTGQYMQYHPPSDVTATYTLPSSASTIGKYQITNIQIMCGSAVCSSSNLASPKYYTFQTSFTLTPSSIMRPILCTSGNSTNRCKYTLNYTERFQ